MAIRFLLPEEELDPGIVRAAAYVRMSTDMQVHSIDNQLQVIEAYAVQHQMQIVQTYADPGRSGLTLTKRPALQALLQDVESGPEFSVVLVYDVSRWGRFQDVDESAFYEYRCKKAGVQIVYCAEQFGADGSPMASVFKSLKRVMAAEFSRDLSRKVFLGQCRMTELGFWAGGPPGYGLSRVLVSRDGQTRRLLTAGQSKSLHTDRVVLAPGPHRERRIVRRIFHEYVERQLSKSEIARRLNAEDVPSLSGAPWNGATVHRVLVNENLVGTNVYNKTTKRLGAPKTRNPKDRWVRASDAFQGIVDPSLFRRAQARIYARSGDMTREEMLVGLKRTLKKHGKLSARIIDAEESIPTRATYQRYFGPLTKLYATLGYTPPYDVSVVLDRNARYAAASLEKRRLHRIKVEEQKVAMLAALRALLDREGRLSEKIITNDRSTPSAALYAKRFGSMMTAYGLIGYVPEAKYMHLIARSTARRAARLAQGASPYRKQEP